MKTFYIREHKDAGDVFLQALLEAGYERVETIEEADFGLYDHDHYYQQGMKPVQTDKPMVIFPHVPYSWWLWDGILTPQPVVCNMVVSEGAKEAMKLYGYPYPVEIVGAAGMEVKPFKATKRTRLLFAPAHPVHDGKYPQKEAIGFIRAAVDKIIRHMNEFESVTVRYSHTLEACGLEKLADLSMRQRNKVTLEHYEPYIDLNLREQALQSIRRADLVISNSTFGYLSVAEGKPTIFYGYDKKLIPFSREGYVKSYPLYKHIFHFPLNFVDMPIRDIMATRTEANPAVENWKRLNVGENFCKDKFLDVIREYV